MIETSPSAPYSNMLLWILSELKLWGQTREKIWNFDRIFLEEQGVHKKKPMHNSEFGWQRYDRNKSKCSIFEPAPMNSDLTKTLRTGRDNWEKNLKIWQNIPWRTRNPLRKCWAIPSSDEGDMIEISPKERSWLCHTEKNWVHVTPLR